MIIVRVLSATLTPLNSTATRGGQGSKLTR